MRFDHEFLSGQIAKRILAAGITVAWAASASAFVSGFPESVVTGDVEVNPNDDYACRATNVSDQAIQLDLFVVNQSGAVLAEDHLVAVAPWQSVELVYDVPSTPLANRTVACKVELIDVRTVRVNGTSDQRTGATKNTTDGKPGVVTLPAIEVDVTVENAAVPVGETVGFQVVRTNVGEETLNDIDTDIALDGFGFPDPLDPDGFLPGAVYGPYMLSTACSNAGGFHTVTASTTAVSADTGDPVSDSDSASVACVGAGEGDCCSSNGSTGCDDLSCQTAVCEVDSFCCNTAWDSTCQRSGRTLRQPMPPLMRRDGTHWAARHQNRFALSPTSAIAKYLSIHRLNWRNA